MPAIERLLGALQRRGELTHLSLAPRYTRSRPGEWVATYRGSSEGRFHTVTATDPAAALLEVLSGAVNGKRTTKRVQDDDEPDFG